YREAKRKHKLYAFKVPVVSKKRPITKHIWARVNNSLIAGGGLSANDTIDYHHAVVPTAYCDFVVLDGKWADRIHDMKFPPRLTARVFSVIELDQFIASI